MVACNNANSSSNARRNFSLGVAVLLLLVFSMKSLPLLCALLGAFSLAASAQAPAKIAAIQGGGDNSPLLNKNVIVEGVVTANFLGADKFSGFFVQDPVGDDDPATSEGVFVYLPDRSPLAQTALQAGDRVQISGRVARYKGQTQISSPTALKVLAHGEPVAAQLVTLAPTTNWESLEGMLVHFDQTLVVVAQNDLLHYGMVKLAPARTFNPTNERSIEQVKAAPEPVPTLELDDGSDDSYPKANRYLGKDGTLRTGTTLTGLTGIVSEYDGSYRIEPTVDPVLTDANPRPALPVVGGTLKVAAANVLNYWTTFKSKDNPNARGADNAVQFERQSAKVIAELKGLDADITGLMEVENNGEATINELVRRLNAAYGTAEYAVVPPPATGLGTDAIRVAMIYKPAKVELIGASQSATDAVFDRLPFAQTFRDKGTRGVFTVVVNHFKSKGSAPKNPEGDIDRGEGAWNIKRTEQARRLVNFVEQLQQSSGDPDVLAIGDLNAYVEESPLLELREAGLKHLNLRVPPAERYSFSYDGFFGSLDHALATPSLDGQVSGIGEWHINADEPYFNTYDKIKPDAYRPDFYRASDHDPLLIGLNLAAN